MDSRIKGRSFVGRMRALLVLVLVLVPSGLAPIQGAPVLAQDNSPHFNVDPDSESVWGHERPANDAVQVFINGDLVDEPSTDASGNFGTGFDPAVRDIVPGDLVEVTGGSVTNGLSVTGIAITGVDVDNDTVSGVADGDHVDVWVDESDVWRREAVAGGSWTANFGVPGDEGGEEATIDLTPGMHGGSNECDDDGDCTFAHWESGERPHIHVNPLNDNILGGFWLPDTTLEIAIDDPLTPEEPDHMVHWDTWGDGAFDFNLWDEFGIDVEHYDVVTTTDYNSVADMIVVPIEVTSVDIGVATASGTSLPDEVIWVQVLMEDADAWRYTTANGAGIWSVDFTIPGTEDEDRVKVVLDHFDPGWTIRAHCYDFTNVPGAESSDNDASIHDWRIPGPGTLYVDGVTGGDDSDCSNPADPCATIGYALTEAGNGDEIRVAQGTYTENLRITQGNTITLRGGYDISGTAWIPTESGETVIDGNEAESAVLIRFGSNATFENLTVTGGRGTETPGFGNGCGGFKIQDGDVAIRNCRIISNTAGDGMGGAICAAGDSRDITLTVEDTIIADNDGVGGGGALNLYHATAFLTNVLIYGNTAEINSVLQVYQAGSDVTFQNCTIGDNTQAGPQAIYIADPDTLTVRNSILWNNGQSIAVDEGEHSCTDCVTVTYSDIQGGWAGTGNIDAAPHFTDPSGGDYHLLPWSPCIDSGTGDGAPDHDFEGDPRPQNAGFDMGADEFTGTPMPSEGPRYVAMSGSDDANICVDSGAPCRTVGHAVEMANAGESVLVAQGTYTENLVVAKRVTLEGGYSGPPNWDRDVAVYETVILNDQVMVPGDWDGRTVGKPAVIRDGAELKMWYDGHNLDDETALGLATSTDGLTWTKSVANPVLAGTPGDWDAASPEHGSYVIKEDGIYKMWYEGSPDHGVRQTGYATSTDGVEWSKYPGNPVIQAGPEGYDKDAAAHGSVLHEGGTYKRWYHAQQDESTTIAYATAPDEVTWTKQGPVLLPQPGEWDAFHLWGPSVLKLDGTYWMWYAAAGPVGPPAIGVVTSTDGISWTRFLTGPVVSEKDPIGDPMVISDSGKLKMWYSNYGRGTVDYAESENGINWTAYPANPVLEPGNLGSWGGRVVHLDYGSDGVVLDGFTITGGDAFAGGGLLIANNGSALVSNCTITGNQSSEGWGGGIWVTNADATIRDSLIAANQGGGIDVNPDHGPAHLALEDSRLVNNQNGGMTVNGVSADLTNVLVAGSTGGGLSAIDGGVVTIQDSKFSGNDGAIRNSGILTITGSTIEDHSGADWTIWSDDHLVMDGCTIRGNGTWGIVHIHTGHAAIRNTMVVDNDNAAINGDIIGIGGPPSTTPAVEFANVLLAGNNSARPTMNGSSPNGSITLMNVTVADNRSPDFPILAGNGTWTVTNTIVWGNTTPGDMLGLGTFSVSYSDIEGGWTATGNIDADPIFVDSAGGDYRLGVDSPCIDKGTLAGAPAADIEGTPRDAAPDMGAYEWTGFRIFMPLTVRNFGS